MLNKNKLLAVLLLLLITSCSEVKKIIVHNCPNSSEANADILRSINKKTTFFKNNNIEVEINNDKCGYTLIYNKEKKIKL